MSLASDYARKMNIITSRSETRGSLTETPPSEDPDEHARFRRCDTPQHQIWAPAKCTLKLTFPLSSTRARDEDREAAAKEEAKRDPPTRTLERIAVDLLPLVLFDLPNFLHGVWAARLRSISSQRHFTRSSR